MLLYACSTNPGKLAEFALAAQQAEVPDLRVEILPGIREIAAPAETGVTFEENAALKATYYSGFTPELVFADDSGLEVDALGGEPGIFSARYAGSGASDIANNELLLRRLQNVINRHARFVCVIALAHKGRLLRTFRGIVEGEILHAPRGVYGFGYDPLFYYQAFGCAFGEVTPEMKFTVSHRGNAIRALLAWLQLNCGRVTVPSEAFSSGKI
jgi:XTP/dITP diphosphohydrolase